jgi:YVTN family beta-propeller protein
MALRKIGRRPLLSALALLTVLAAACLARDGRPAAPAYPAPGPGPLSAGMLALSDDGRLLASANPDSNSLTLVDALDLRVLAEVPVGTDPRMVSFTPDGGRLLAANRLAGSISIVDVTAASVVAEVAVGGLPYGVLAASERLAFASLWGRGQVAVLDLETGSVTARIDVEPFPAGLALSADRRSLYVTHLYTGRLSMINTAELVVRSVISAPAEANMAQFVLLSPDGIRAWLPLTHSLADNLDLAYDSTVLPAVHVVDTQAGRELESERLMLADLAGPVSLPFAAALSPDGRRLYVANAGSDDVLAVDLAARQAIGRLAAGANPRGLLLAPDGARLFVANSLDGSLDVFDTASLARTHTLALTRIPLSLDVLEGKRLFHSARPPMSHDGWISCASCHLDGAADARTWLGFADGPRRTPALWGAADTLPLHWNGDLDELHDVEHTVRDVQFGQGLIDGSPHPPLGAPNAGRSAALDALAAYLATLQAPPSPFAPQDEDEAAAVERGERAFRRWGCAVCHPGPLYTDLARHISHVGDPALERNQAGPLPRFDTPSLVGVWATAPYFHNGSSASLRDTLFAPGFHSMGYAMDAREIDDVLVFMRALPLDEPAGHAAP